MTGGRLAKVPFRTGTIKIVSTSTAPATIDGIAFLRVNPQTYRGS